MDHVRRQVLGWPSKRWRGVEHELPKLPAVEHLLVPGIAGPVILFSSAIYAQDDHIQRPRESTPGDARNSHAGWSYPTAKSKYLITSEEGKSRVTCGLVDSDPRSKSWVSRML
jgi:hypothetical protein